MQKLFVFCPLKLSCRDNFIRKYQQRVCWVILKKKKLNEMWWENWTWTQRKSRRNLLQPQKITSELNRTIFKHKKVIENQTNEIDLKN